MEFLKSEKYNEQDLKSKPGVSINTINLQKHKIFITIYTGKLLLVNQSCWCSFNKAQDVSWKALKMFPVYWSNSSHFVPLQ